MIAVHTCVWSALTVRGGNPARVGRRHPKGLRAVVAVVALAFGACGNPDPPQSPTTTPGLISEVYTGRLTPGGSGFYAFRANVSASASYTLASLTLPSSGRAVDAVITLGVGVPAGEDCNVTSSTLAAPGLAPQLSSNVSPGVYCVRVSDPGTLTTVTNFAVRIQHP